jgi:trk/ktr system potassium uptake protein
MKMIIVGCGRVGCDLSLALTREGHSVTVVDIDESAFEKLGARFPGQKIVGVGFDRDVLLQAGIERADGLAAVTSSDNANIVTARIAKNVYRVPQVVTRLYEPSRAEVYRRLGLQTISSTAWGANRIMQLLTHSRLDPMLELGSGEVSLVEIEIGAKLAGRTVQDLNISTEIKVMAITRNGKAFIPSAPNNFALGDRVQIAVLKSAQTKFEALVGW